MDINLVDVVVLCAYIEFVSLLLRELHGCHFNMSLILSSMLLIVEEVEIHLWVAEFTLVPLAHFRVIRNRHDVMCVLGSDYCQRIDRIVMAVFCQDTLLDWCTFSPHVPLNNVARCGRAEDHVWVMRVEDGLGNFILTG